MASWFLFKSYSLHFDNLWLLLWCCKGHRRSGSYGNAVVLATTSAAVSTVAASDVMLPTITTTSGGLDDNTPVSANHSVPGTTRSASWAYGVRPQGVILMLISYYWSCYWCLRSVGTSRLVVPSVKRSTVGSRAFPVATSQTWNSLPEDVTSASTLRSFQQRLKTHLFRQCFSVL